MKLVKRILAGLDFRPDTEAVLRTAAVVAKRLGSEVSLLHVIPPVSSLPLVEDIWRCAHARGVGEKGVGRTARRVQSTLGAGRGVRQPSQPSLKELRLTESSLTPTISTPT